MKALGLLLVILTLAGCGDIRVIRDNGYESIETNTSKYIKSYTIGDKKTVYIGEPIVSWKSIDVKSTSLPKIYVPKTAFELEGNYFKRNLFPSNITIKANEGDYYYYRGTTSYNGIGYKVLGKNEKENGYYLLINEMGILNNNLLIDEHLDRKLISENATSSPKEVIFLEGPKEKFAYTPGLAHEIIYGGLNNVTLNATYREYTPSDMARQAFYQNLVYETKAEVIRFRGFKIMLHDVSNEKITFTVLEDGLPDPVIVSK